ncbi:MAG: BrnT family toxin [Planctomycetes bacterium]|nr:BrnT family toxin [Planctomycetota bacterium]
MARHGVRPDEAEEVFFGRIYVKHAGRGRYLVLGRTGTGRYLFLIVIRWPGGLVRVITARDMIERERRLYQQRRK